MASVSTTSTRTVWQLDPSHLEVGFAVRHLMISTVKGRFPGVRGTVTTEGDDFGTAKVDVTVDVATIDTREPKRDEHLRSADFFHVAEFPHLTFTSRRVERLTKNQYKLIGDLTIRGTTREVALDVTSEGFIRDPWGFERAGFSATGLINRKEFGLTWNVILETGGLTVGEEVKLTIEAELVRQAVRHVA